MVRATLRMTVAPGDGPAFEAAWRRVAAVVAANPANLGQALLRDDADPHTYLVSSDWASLDDFAAFELSPAQDRLTEPLRRLRVRAEMHVRQVVHRVAPDAPHPTAHPEEQTA
jgi:heme-degrading monooxygenase HmoA